MTPCLAIANHTLPLLSVRHAFDEAVASCAQLLHAFQVRCHARSAVPTLCSQYFYDNALQDGPNIKDASPEVFYEAPLLKPYVFFDVAGGREAGGGGGSRSKTNRVSRQ